VPYYLREPYAKTVHVPPPGCTLERWLEIAEIAYNARATVSGSADDALSHAPGQYAAGIFYDLPASEQPDYVVFRDVHYPGAMLQFAGESGGNIVPPVVPPEPPPAPLIRPPGTRGAILLHWMPTGIAGVPNFMQTLNPPAIKLVAACSNFVDVRAWNPATLIAYRRVEDGLDVYNPSQAAEFVQRYIADLTPNVNLADFSQPPIYLVSINEKYECRHPTQNAACAAWDCAFMTAIEQTGLNLRGMVYTAPVGNPEPDAQDLVPLLPMVAQACAGGHLLGKHSYYANVPGDPAFYQASWEWYGGRFAKDDLFFTSQGLYPYWLLGEGGACEATIHQTAGAAYASRSFVAGIAGRDWPNRVVRIIYAGDRIVDIVPVEAAEALSAGASSAAANSYIVTLNPGAGWKACGSVERYRDELMWADAWYMNWNAAHGGRLLGVALFTAYGWGWDKFRLDGGDLDVITAALAIGG
jgi:hypothetical protein